MDHDDSKEVSVPHSSKRKYSPTDNNTDENPYKKSKSSETPKKTSEFERKSFIPNRKNNKEEKTSRVYQKEKYLTFDEERKMYYYGNKIPELKSLTEQEKINVQQNKISIFLEEKEFILTTESISNKEERMENLLKARNSTNVVFHDIDLLRKYENLLNDKDRRSLVNRISSTYVEPYYVHGSVNMIFENDSEYIGTGTLIGKRVFITAAHNLYDRKTKKYVKSVLFCPGRDNHSIYWEGYGIMAIIHPNYIKDDETDYLDWDLGVVILKKDFEENFDGDSPLGYFAYDFLKPGEIESVSLNITGYPGAAIIDNSLKITSGEAMFTMTEDRKEIKKIASNKERIYYDIDTSPGQSGSGIWFKSTAGQYVCCGVHTHGGDINSGNIGTYISQKKRGIIDEWIKSETN
jgi:V8-like Glu-specific endopeptidase